MSPRNDQRHDGALPKSRFLLTLTVSQANAPSLASLIE
jgi:hypothetical protein